MARKVYLSSLTAGRCFTVPPNDQADADESEKEKMSYGRTMMAAENAWKVVLHGAESAQVENAAGETTEMPLDSLVVEIPRQGYDRLKGRG